MKRLADSNRDGTFTPDEAFHGVAVAPLQAANIQLIDDSTDGSSGSDLMHHKFLVIDQTTVIRGSARLTSSAFTVMRAGNPAAEM